MLPDKLHKTAMQPGKKPFSYTPAGLDLSQVNKSPGRVRRSQGGLPSMSPSQRVLASGRVSGPSPQSVRPAAEPRTPQSPSTYGPGPGMATVKHAQFNSPLGLYTSENVEEAFVGQTAGVVTGVHG